MELKLKMFYDSTNCSGGGGNHDETQNNYNQGSRLGIDPLLLSTDSSEALQKKYVSLQSRQYLDRMATGPRRQLAAATAAAAAARPPAAPVASRR